MGVRISIKHGDIASQVAVNRIIETLFGRGYARLRTAFYISTVLAAQLVVRCVDISAGHVGDLERIIYMQEILPEVAGPGSSQTVSSRPRSPY